jgi:fumarate reductase subunit D
MAEPEGRRRRLYRLVDHGDQLDREGVQVDLALIAAMFALVMVHVWSACHRSGAVHHGLQRYVVSRR